MHIFLAIVFTLHFVEGEPETRIPIAFENRSSFECFSKVILESRAKNVHFINAEISAKFLKNFAWTSFNKPSRVVLATEWEDLCVVFPEDFETLLSLLRTFHECHRAKIMIVFSTLHVSAMKSLFDFSWKLGITDIIVVSHIKGSCHIYTYIPFDKDSCFDTSPVVINTKLNGSTEYFPKKVTHMNSCQIQIEYSMKSRQSSHEPEIRFHGLIDFLASAMKSKPYAIYRVSSSYPDIIDNETALLFAPFNQNLDRDRRFVFSPVTTAARVGLCLPSRRASSVEWFRIFTEFSVHVWCAVFSVFLFVVLYSYFFVYDRKELGFAVLATLQELLNTPSPMVPILRWQDRLCFPLWLTLCLVLNCAYQSSLKSKLTVPVIRDAIESVADLVESDVPVFVPTSIYSSAKDHWLRKPEYLPLLEKVVEVQGVTVYELYVNHNGTFALFCDKEDIYYYFRGSSYRLLPDFDYETLVSPFMLLKPSPLERLFKKSMVRILDAGAFDYTYDRAFSSQTSKFRKMKDNRSSLSLRALSAVFMVWVVGCCVALLCFIGEVFTRNRIKLYP